MAQEPEDGGNKSGKERAFLEAVPRLDLVRVKMILAVDMNAFLISFLERSRFSDGSGKRRAHDCTVGNEPAVPVVLPVVLRCSCNA